ncbi:MAG: SDR family NAD(P)-dependent oxidoreductase [Solirubrobacterales bacterium]|nr:SDR family NAD(P)-dependent oxidoreductase [Solirubrobacterales bacterium]
MRILVTGGTGYIGSHAVAALVRGGHEIRLLVRSPDRIAPALEPLGVDDVAHVPGDITDPASVRRAMEGCDAVVHAASVYSLDVRDARTTERVNVPGTENVLGEAARRGLDPIVYVSSTIAFLPGNGTRVGPESPVGDPAMAYARSKAAAERVARAHQERGDPVAIVYPGQVWGPCDPYLGETLELARNVLKRRLPVLPRGGHHIVDVRDVAATILALCEGGRGPRPLRGSGPVRRDPPPSDRAGRRHRSPAAVRDPAPARPAARRASRRPAPAARPGPPPRLGRGRLHHHVRPALRRRARAARARHLPPSPRRGDHRLRALALRAGPHPAPRGRAVAASAGAPAGAEDGGRSRDPATAGPIR